ncbi:alpha/beta fold hydrolase [Pseudonocardia sp. ICBG162]|uniref:alpha/beta fold hydrolase n=1 Tax=Pseudonocardia sp. ICBG162 TaxID=2846761 RepID=UPI0015BEDE3F|nr:alpha/beta hydrolase [Pseudonocardia sp. ICBG162]NWJ74009.1 alpha/beta fold hydrolase [Pseudonocardia pini]
MPTTVRTRAGRLSVTVEGSGPPALLWHSLLVDSTQWDRVRAELGARRTLLLVDGPGHGRSGPPPRGTSFAGCADAALEVLDAVGADGPVDWIGNAWGGHVGYHFAARHPGRCRTLVAVAAPHTPLPPSQRARIAALVALHRLTGPHPLRGVVVDTLLSPAARAGDPEAVRRVEEAFLRGHRTGMNRVMVAMMLRRPDLTGVLRRVTAPTLLVAGAADPLWSGRRADAAAAVLPAGSALVVDGSGHLPPLEAPAAFAGAVVDHWAAPVG